MILEIGLGIAIGAAFVHFGHSVKLDRAQQYYFKGIEALDNAKLHHDLARQLERDIAEVHE